MLWSPCIQWGVTVTVSLDMSCGPGPSADPLLRTSVVVFVKSQSKSEAWDLFNSRFLWIVHCRNVLISQLLKTFTVNNENMLGFGGYLLHYQKLCQGWNKFLLSARTLLLSFIIELRVQNTVFHQGFGISLFSTFCFPWNTLNSWNCMSLAKMKKKNTQKTCVNIVQIFSCWRKKFFLIYLVFFQFPPYVGPGATFLHALGKKYIPRIWNKLFTDVLIIIVSQFLWKPIRSILLIKVWNTLKVSIHYLDMQRDKWLRLIWSSKPSLPRYNSLSGGSWCHSIGDCHGPDVEGQRKTVALPSSLVRLLRKTFPEEWASLLWLSPQAAVGIEEVL